MTIDLRYRIKGGASLKGDVQVGGSKNATLPLLAACLLCNNDVTLHNVPGLSDVRTMLKTMEYLGAETSFNDGTVKINAAKLQSKPIPSEYVSKLRGSIVLMAPLLARFGVAEMSYPGGCVLGKRPVDAHIIGFKQLGISDMSTDDVLHLQGTPKHNHVILPEFSVTATENMLILAASLEGETRIDHAAAEPHVQDLCHFLEKSGVEIDGIGTHTLHVKGIKECKSVEHTVTFDYLEAGALTIAALITNGKVNIHGVDKFHLLSFIDTLQRAGASLSHHEDEQMLTVDGEESQLKSMKVQTNIFPGFPTDLQAPMGVLMTQADGVSRMHEVLFERRMAYLYELEKMGAHIEVLNDHQALIIGPTPLKGRTVASNDIRAGAAMVLAALCAEGETMITDVRYIERGYDRLDEKLNNLGASIKKIELNGS